ncbi:MAG TPA: rod shape-determining protein RodA [Clostridiales bacterium]|nr:rod shape-determining protein RodA [Clostridiales bacterium]
MRKYLKMVREYIKKSDMLLLSLCIICSIYGIVIISSATKSFNTNQYVYIQSGALFLGIIAFVVMSLLDLDIITDKWRWIFAFNILFFLTLVLWGVEGGTGNRGWLRFGPIGIQPAEVVKITFTILLAKQICFLNSHNLNAPISVAQLVAHFVVMFGLIILVSDDLGSALVYLVIFIVMLFAAGLKLRWFGLGLLVFAAASPIFWNMLGDYQKERILAPYFPEVVDPSGLGVTWQANQSKIALASGGLKGAGLYSGIQSQSDALPFKHTDFIFAVAGEELGLIGCLAIIVLLTAVILRCIYVGIKCNDPKGMLVCMGFAGMLIFQTFENIGMCVGLTPVIGLTLPFFSYGGSSILTLFAAMGVVSGIWFRRKPGRRHYSSSGY